MSKIYKEKLLEEIPCKGTGNFNGSGCKGCHNYNDDHNTTGECIYSVIKNFPEEPAIDFDALYKEYSGSVQFDSTSTAWKFRDFLKSKNLTAPQIDMDQLRNDVYSEIVKTKPFEIPVKKTWKIKHEFAEFCESFGLCERVNYSPDSFNNPSNKKFYDLHEEPDYSKIPKGSIVVVSSKDDKIKSAEIVDHFDSNYIYCNVCGRYELKCVKIRIVELAKE